MKKYLLLLAIPLAIFACADPDLDAGPSYAEAPALPEVPFDYESVVIPGNPHPWGGQKLNIKSEVTDAGATLGRVLFYDKKLSLNNRVSCGSCHKQAFGFADPVAGSQGFENKITPRNSMSISNMKLESTLFWDQRASDLEQQVLMPVENHIEMGMEKMDHLEQKLSLVAYYPHLFKEAFGDNEITEKRISFAISQFLQTIVSLNSKYDIGEKTNFANFTPKEIQGKELFFNRSKTHCSSCHGGDNFGGGSANIGLDKEYDDPGIQAVTGEEWQHGMFKIPSLRDIAVTGPYMHDGRFNTLMDVLNHYSENVQFNPNLDWRMFQIGDNGGFDPNGPLNPRHLKLNQFEKDALIAFLQTLTDESLRANPIYSDPFLLN